MSVTLGSVGAGESIVGTPTSTTVATKSIAEGTNISIDTSSTELTITGANAPTNAPICILSITSDVSVTDATSSNIPWDTAIYNPDGLWDSMSNPDRITILESGIYQYNVSLRWQGSLPAGIVTTTVNRTTSAPSTTAQATSQLFISASAPYSCNVSFMSYFDATDYITVLATNATGKDLLVLSENPGTRISIQKIRGV